MAWTWRFEKSDGTETEPAPRPEEFTTQGDAESWIGEFWKELLEGGAEQVTLFEDGAKIYGPMSLRADQADPAGQAEQTDEAERTDPPVPAEQAEQAEQA